MLNLLGKKFGDLTVLSRVENRTISGNPYKWLCQCRCGKQCTPRGSHLMSGASTSCGACKTEGRAFRDLICRYKVSARRRGVEYKLTSEEFKNITSSPCFYTGRPPNNVVRVPGVEEVYVYNGIDRMDSSKGYTVDNCVPCCEAANKAKLDMSYSDFIKLCAEVTENARQKTDCDMPAPWFHNFECQESVSRAA